MFLEGSDIAINEGQKECPLLSQRLLILTLMGGRELAYQVTVTQLNGIDSMSLR